MKKCKRILTIPVAAVLALCLVASSCAGKKDAGDPLYIETGFTKMFLLPCTGGYLLIDTYYSHDYDRFRSKLKNLGIDVGAIKYILLTHHHDDHSGFAARLRDESGARFIVHRNALDNLEKGRPDMNMRPLNTCTDLSFRAFALFKESGDHSFPPVKMTEGDFIVDGDDNRLLRSLGVEGKIIYTPGHTDDSISVLMDDGRVFAGDLAMDLLNYCACRHRPIWLADMAAIYAGWERLIASGAKVIHPSHGDSFPAGELTETMKEYPLTAETVK